MISRKDIHNLAQLARIEMSKEEETSLTKDVENILDFVDQIQSVKTVAKKGEGDIGVIKNTMREDGEPHRSGKYTEELLDEAPHKHKGFVKVKKII